MRLGFHSFVLTLMTVLNGTIMLIGPGLHSLPGCEYGAVERRDAGSGDDGFHMESGEGVSVASCLVCEYLAQAQVAAERVLTATTTVLVSSVPAPTPTISDLQTPRILRLRAPPVLVRV